MYGMTGLPLLAFVACLTEPSLVHTSLPGTFAQFLVCLRSDVCYEAGDGVTTKAKSGKPVISSHGE
jgi:hypothetical protein